MEQVEFERGQRLVSDYEPELGMGIVLKRDATRVEVFFPASNEHRQYAVRSAPLRRVRFKEGDRITLHTGERRSVSAVRSQGSLLVYETELGPVEEAQLADFISFTSPEERLLGGQVDEPRLFDLRLETWRQRARLRRSPVRGLSGGRVDLLAHQLFIAQTVTGRLAPRALLADEVGLGKTIEAGLIIHRLVLGERARRVLVLVPEPLVNQWFFELWRRFNLMFSVYDAERCAAIEAGAPGANPFRENQWIIASCGFAADDPVRARQLEEAGFDLLVVDEAHHLEWHPEVASPGYILVEALARKIRGVLLLTATPQQLGLDAHFARLRLLDPERYSDWDAFLQETRRYHQVADAIESLRAGQAVEPAFAAELTARSPRAGGLLERSARGDVAARGELVEDLLDAFGTGRALFRNTRRALSGFPKRKAFLVPLGPGAKGRTEDPEELRVRWLVGLLQASGTEKFLLVAHARETAESLAEKVRSHLDVPLAVFHEGLTLLQRDRNAAYFAEPDGARVLICSEIGSEGRNFQFAHHLVLWDLPRNPELLEQRIGRLDRIGQRKTVQIHVPYVPKTAEEVWMRWYHEGLNAFEEPARGAGEIYGALAGQIDSACDSFSAAAVRKLVQETRRQREEVEERLAHGEDRLLRWASCRSETAEKIVAALRAVDADAAFEEYALRLLDQCGVAAEGGDHGDWVMRPGPMMREALATLPAEGFCATFSRQRALAREDFRFLGVDHPLISEAMDALLGNEKGNCSFVVWDKSGEEAMLLEAVIVLECVADADLELDRFFPQQPLRVVVDATMRDRSEDADWVDVPWQVGDVFRLLDRGAVKKKLLPGMLERVKSVAADRMLFVVSEARAEMDSALLLESNRLEELSALHPEACGGEAAAFKARAQRMREALSGARFRVDALRLVWKQA
jgi:ATP-dependent helicase HepA